MAQPAKCAGGCGFYASASKGDGYCSKCTPTYQHKPQPVQDDSEDDDVGGYQHPQQGRQEPRGPVQLRADVAQAKLQQLQTLNVEFPEGGYNITYKTLTGKTVTQEVSAEMTVEQLAAAMCDREGWPPNIIRIIYTGQSLYEAGVSMLGNNITMRQVGIGKDVTIHIVLMLRGD